MVFDSTGQCIITVSHCCKGRERERKRFGGRGEGRVEEGGGREGLEREREGLRREEGERGWRGRGRG